MSIMEDEENSNTTNLNKIISHPTQFALLLLFLLFLIVTLIPALFVYSTTSAYNDSTLAEMHISAANNLLITFVTLLYVLLTVVLVTQSKEAVIQSKEAVIQSKEAIAQSKKEQQIRDIENRLEKFYIPADEIINHPISKKSRNDTIHGHQGGLKDSGYVIGLKHLRKYSYLADKTTYDTYEKYINNICESRKSITCRDMYRDFNDYNCKDKSGNCIEINWAKCKNNIDRCEHFSECPTKDQDNIIINNTECKNYKRLKDAITEDIKKYKKRLSELKE